MNTTPDHLDPDHLDDGILSALLDGDAGEVGADGSPDAAAHLSACDRCAGRQAELGAARAALAAAPVEALDELTRRRLVAAALTAVGEPGGATTPGTPAALGRSRRFQRHPALIGSAAAVLLALLVGIPFVVGNDGDQNGTTLSAQAPEASREESASPFLGDLGDLTDRDHLRLRLSGAAADAALGYAPAEPGPSPAAGAPTAALMPGAGPAGGGLSSPPASTGRSAVTPTTIAPTSQGAGGSKAAKPSAENSTADTREPHQPPPGQSDTFASEQQAADRDRVDTDTCVAALLNGPARGGRLTRSGVGTYQGRPAIVASFELEGGTVAFIADRSGCAVLDRFSM
jgi:hypothetical protein